MLSSRCIHLVSFDLVYLTGAWNFMKAHGIRHVLVSIMEHRIANKCRRDVGNPIPSAAIPASMSMWMWGSVSALLPGSIYQFRTKSLVICPEEAFSCPPQHQDATQCQAGTDQREVPSAQQFNAQAVTHQLGNIF